MSWAWQARGKVAKRRRLLVGRVSDLLLQQAKLLEKPMADADLYLLEIRSQRIRVLLDQLEASHTLVADHHASHSRIAWPPNSTWSYFRTGTLHALIDWIHAALNARSEMTTRWLSRIRFLRSEKTRRHEMYR
jgi:hypothetical protein